MTRDEFLAEGKAKIDAFFSQLEHVSASIGDVKALGALLLEHLAGPAPEPVAEEAPAEKPAPVPLSVVEQPAPVVESASVVEKPAEEPMPAAPETAPEPPAAA
jgi:hypothetical protein